ncbi:MAG: hypothetical protein GF410_10380 [Chitinivibrionales bacterium]|nr:hypothetical protein [Chitinivibrionales bacterium]
MLESGKHQLLGTAGLCVWFFSLSATAALTLTHSHYSAEANNINLWFSDNIDDATIDSTAAIGFSADDSSQHYVSLTNWSWNTAGQVNDNIFQIEIDAATAAEIESLPGGTTHLPGGEGLLKISLPANLVWDITNTSGSDPVSFADNATPFYDGPNPGVGGPEFDANSNTLRLWFSQAMNTSGTNLSGTIGLSVDSGQTNSIVLNTPLSVSWPGDPPHHLAKVQLDAAQATTVESWPNVETNLWLKLDSLVFYDTAGRGNELVDYRFCHSVRFFGPEPEVVGAWFMAREGVLWIRFSRSISDNLINTSGAVSLSTDEGTAYALTVATPWSTDTTGAGNDSTIGIVLGSSQTATLSSWPNLESLKLALGDSVVTDPSGAYGNSAVAYSDNVPVWFNPPLPTLQSVSYCPNRSLFIMQFDQALSDAAADLSGSIQFSVDGGGSNSITLATPLALTTGATSNDNQVYLTLSDAEASVVNSWPNKETAMTIALDSNIVWSSDARWGNSKIAFEQGWQVTCIGPISFINALDMNANGLLDAIGFQIGDTLNPIDWTSVSVSVYLDSENSWHIDSIIEPSPFSFFLRLREDSTINGGGPQTGVTPRVRFSPFPGTSQDLDTICSDAAGPIVWSAELVPSGGASGQPELHIALSEKVMAADSTLVSNSEEPSAAFVLWAPTTDGTPWQQQDSLLTASADYFSIGDSTFILQLTSNHGISTSNYLTLNANPARFMDLSGNGAQPHNMHRKITVAGQSQGSGSTGQSEDMEMTLSTNSISATDSYHESFLMAYDYDTATSRAQLGGVVVSVPVYLSGESSNIWVAAFSVYAPSGLPVYSRCSNGDVVPSEWRSNWVQGELKELHFYWNGTTDYDEPMNAGQHRLVVKISEIVGDEQTDLYTYTATIENPEEDSNCGNCGTDVYLALIPPAGFGVGSAMKKRRPRRRPNHCS